MTLKIFFSSCIIVAICLLYVQGENEDVARLIPAITKASVRAAGWLSQHILNNNTDLGLAGAAQLAMFTNLFYCSTLGCDMPLHYRDLFNKYSQVKPEEMKTNDLINLLVLRRAVEDCSLRHQVKNLASLLLNRMRYFPERDFNHPSTYSFSLIALALNEVEIPSHLIEKMLLRWMKVKKGMPDSAFAYQALALSVLELRRPVTQGKKTPYTFLKRLFKDTSYALKDPDVNEITIATLLQVNMALQKCLPFRSQDLPYRAIQKLLAYQKSDGSFGDAVTTAFVLPAISGMSILDLHRVNCTVAQNDSVEKANQTMTACIKIHFKGNERQNPPVQYFNTTVGVTAMEILQQASRTDTCYQFRSKVHSFGMYITEVCGVAEDHVNKRYWMFYVDEKLSRDGLSNYKVQKGECIRLVLQRLKF